MSEIYKAISLAQGFWCVEEGGVRSFLIEGREKALLVDTGFGRGDLKSFVETLVSRPVFVVNTHSDKDHVGCNARFKEVYMHPAEMDHYYQKCEEANSLRLLPAWEGDVFDVGGRALEVVLIPGHTPGSIALLDRENKILLSGDSVQSGPIFMFGSGRNLPAFIESMRKLEGMKEAFDTILPCHGPFNLDKSILPSLIEGAKKLLSGEIEGEDPGRDLPCKLYRLGDVQFLY